MSNYIKKQLETKLKDVIKYVQQQDITVYLSGGAITSLATNKELNDYDLYFKDKESAASMVDYLLEDSLLQIGNDTLFKFNDEYEDAHILDKILFEGKYLNGDEEVIFTADGKVKGFKPFSIYQPVIDYFFPGMQCDQLLIGHSEMEARERIAFKFSNDTLQLFDLNCIQYEQEYNYCTEVERGELLYTLIKQD